MTRGLERRHNESFTCISHSSVGYRETPQSLYLQTPTISPKKIEEDFLGRAPKIPVDQPLEGNITQIHPNSTKAHPKCTRRG